MLLLAILSWGTLIALLAILVWMMRLPGVGYGAVHRRRPEARLGPGAPRLRASAPGRR